MVFSEVAYIYMLFAGREVRAGKNCTRGLGYPRLRAQFFPNSGRPRPANNVFIFFRRVLCKQFLC